MFLYGGYGLSDTVVEAGVADVLPVPGSGLESLRADDPRFG